MAKRTKLEITKDLLMVLLEYRKVKITHLIYKTNLSNNSIKPYINDLLKNGLITEMQDEDKKFFVITSKGNEFLQEYKKIKIFSEAFGIGE